MRQQKAGKSNKVVFNTFVSEQIGKIPIYVTDWCYFSQFVIVMLNWIQMCIIEK